MEPRSLSETLPTDLVNLDPTSNELLVDLEPSTSRRSSSCSSTQQSTHFKNSRHPDNMTDLLQQKHTQILKVAVWFPRK